VLFFNQLPIPSSCFGKVHLVLAENDASAEKHRAHTGRETPFILFQKIADSALPSAALALPFRKFQKEEQWLWQGLWTEGSIQ